jgi:DNA-binding HxlR family transcriptional regulator
MVRMPPEDARTGVNRLPQDPVERVLAVIAGRWKIEIFRRLVEGPRRQSEFLREMPGISQKVLITQLRDLEGHGMVRREVHPIAPPRVDYHATELARSLEPVADALCEWGRRHGDELEREQAPTETVPPRGPA